MTPIDGGTARYERDRGRRLVTANYPARTVTPITRHARSHREIPICRQIRPSTAPKDLTSVPDPMNASRRRAIFSWLTAAYLLAVCAWVLYSLYGADVVQALYDRRVGFLSRVLVPKELPSGVDVPIQYYRARFGDLTNAGSSRRPCATSSSWAS